jgi:hypothetical protein
MKKQIQISLPESYGDIDLKKYLDIQKELINYQDDEDAQIAILITYLCGLDVKYISGLNKKDFDLLKQSLQKFLEKTDFPLQRFITIDGVEYGFEPNLSNISYGAYVDITKYDTISIDNNWAKIMSILYRPVTKKVRDTYEIQAYNGIIDDKLFLTVPMNVHFGAYNFFFLLSRDLQTSILNYMKGMDLPPNIKLILERSGEVMHRLLNLQTTIYPESKK